MAWGVNSPQYLTLTEVHDHFISYFLHTSAKFAKVNKSKRASREALGMVLCVRLFVRSKLVAIFKFLAQIKLLPLREPAQEVLRTLSCYGIFAELSVHWILLIFGSTFVSNKEIIALECEKIDIFAVFPLLKMLRIICRKPLRIYNLPTQKQIIFGFLSFF